MKKQLTHMRVGLVPTGYHSIRVMDLDSGDFLTQVTEVDTVAGYLYRYCTNAKGKLVWDPENHCFKIERRVGRFAILGIRSK